jgi:hypothetical protein
MAKRYKNRTRVSGAGSGKGSDHVEFDDQNSLGAAHVDRVVYRTGIDVNDTVGDRAHRIETTSQTVSLVASDDSYADRASIVDF